jgi:hypothetical protein
MYTEYLEVVTQSTINFACKDKDGKFRTNTSPKRLLSDFQRCSSFRNFRKCCALAASGFVADIPLLGALNCYTEFAANKNFAV